MTLWCGDYGEYVKVNADYFLLYLYFRTAVSIFSNKCALLFHFPSYEVIVENNLRHGLIMLFYRIFFTDESYMCLRAYTKSQKNKCRHLWSSARFSHTDGMLNSSFFWGISELKRISNSKLLRILSR